MNRVLRRWITIGLYVLMIPSSLILAEEKSTTPPSPEQWIETDRSASEETKVPVPNFKSLFIKTMFLVGGLLIAATAGLYLLKKAQNRFFHIKGEADILLLERRALSPKTHVFLLSVKGKELIVVESAHQVHVHSLPLHNEAQTERVS